ncbi:UbiA-domain-containing protein [Biscogniauxia marginata]|nr:UbiA-domain-containing protein [Biscogniauxia marginata]
MNRKTGQERQLDHDDSQHEEAPPQRFDGLHTGSWTNRLPASWVPYVQLARLSPPVPLLLIFFPHSFGILHAAIINRIPPASIVRVFCVLLGGSLFLSNAIHGWNDLIDSPIDKLILRTRNRPVPRGAITPQAAFIFTLSQAIAAAFFLLLLPPTTAIYAVPSIIAHTYYPFSKKQIYYPQVVLGISLQWPIILASFSTAPSNVLMDQSLLCLFFGCVLWTVTYDTVYGFQDYKEDIRVGVKSTAVLFGEWGKPILWFLSNSMVALLISSGYLAGMSLTYFAVSVGGCFTSLNVMMAKVNLKSPESCSWWFTYGFWGPAVSISGGLLCEYLFK